MRAFIPPTGGAVIKTERPWLLAAAHARAAMVFPDRDSPMMVVMELFAMA